MSKPLSFFQKIKLFRMYHKHQKNGVVVSCPYCGGTNIEFWNQKEFGDKEITYKSEYVCNDCNALCENTQKWNRL